MKQSEMLATLKELSSELNRYAAGSDSIVPGAYAEALDAAIETLDRMTWISVKDRLPENEQGVIICVERRYYSDPNRLARIIVKAFYTDGKHDTEHSAYSWDSDYMDMEYNEENDAYLIPEGWWESVEYGEEFSAVSDYVTHWMPLPEPPKGENNE